MFGDICSSAFVQINPFIFQSANENWRIPHAFTRQSHYALCFNNAFLQKKCETNMSIIALHFTWITLLIRFVTFRIEDIGWTASVELWRKENKSVMKIPLKCYCGQDLTPVFWAPSPRTNPFVSSFPSFRPCPGQLLALAEYMLHQGNIWHCNFSRKWRKWKETHPSVGQKGYRNKLLR